MILDSSHMMKREAEPPCFFNQINHPLVGDAREILLLYPHQGSMVSEHFHLVSTLQEESTIGNIPLQPKHFQLHY